MSDYVQDIADMLAAGEAAEAKANSEIIDLRDGRRQWTMRIPADPSTDSDLVIGAALRMIPNYIQAIRAAVGQLCVLSTHEHRYGSDSELYCFQTCAHCIAESSLQEIAEALRE